MTDRALLAAHALTDHSIARLVDFVGIESVSGDPQHAGDVARAAQWLADEMLASGMQQATVVRTTGNPVVLGRWQGAGPTAPTVLVYCHYDVQPVEPVSEWTHPPFEATRVGDLLIGRGTADDKGPILEHLCAVRALLETEGGLPVNIIMCVEGEEEAGSPSLPAFLQEYREELGADLVVVSDTTMLGADHPGPTVSMRGVMTLDVTVRTLGQDVHSGKYGGAVLNAASELARLLASLHDKSGRVAVDGFYAGVQQPSSATRASVSQAEGQVGDWIAPTGARGAAGESGWSTLERVWLRPTLEVNGMHSGHTGPGSKTIVPAVASAKISARLVDRQRPAMVADCVHRHLAEMAHPAAEVKVAMDHGGPAVGIDIDHPLVALALQAYESGYGRPAVLSREGGSVPVVAALRDTLQVPVLLMGFGLPTQREHAPDEQLSITNFAKATSTVIHLWRLLSEAGKSAIAGPPEPSRANPRK